MGVVPSLVEVRSLASTHEVNRECLSDFQCAESQALIVSAKKARRA